VLRGEPSNANFLMVFGLTRPGFEISWGEHANYNTKDAISQVSRDPDIKKPKENTLNIPVC